jgi:hypothetical protein
MAQSNSLSSSACCRPVDSQSSNMSSSTISCNDARFRSCRAIHQERCCDRSWSRLPSPFAQSESRRHVENIFTHSSRGALRQFLTLPVQIDKFKHSGAARATTATQLETDDESFLGIRNSRERGNDPSQLGANLLDRAGGNGATAFGSVQDYSNLEGSVFELAEERSYSRLVQI